MGDTHYSTGDEKKLLNVDTKVRNCYVHYEEVFKVEEF